METTVNKKPIGAEAKKILRKLSKQIPNDRMLLLPDCKFTEYQQQDIHHFEPVNLPKLLYFIADMI